jgi:hypothetical protein
MQGAAITGEASAAKLGGLFSVTQNGTGELVGDYDAVGHRISPSALDGFK